MEATSSHPSAFLGTWVNISQHLQQEPPLDSSAPPPLSPPASFLDSSTMQLHGAMPVLDPVGEKLVECKQCNRTISERGLTSHLVACRKLKGGSGKKGTKKKDHAGKEAGTNSLKRKSSDADPGDEPPPKKSKVSLGADGQPKKKGSKAGVPKLGRNKGPVNVDIQCGVINDKGVPCSRSLTCKSHSMGAKRAVPGRSAGYDELLLAWQKKTNPNFVERVKKDPKPKSTDKPENAPKKPKKQAAPKEHKGRPPAEPQNLVNRLFVGDPDDSAHPLENYVDSDEEYEQVSEGIRAAMILHRYRTERVNLESYKEYNPGLHVIRDRNLARMRLSLGRAFIGASRR